MLVVALLHPTDLRVAVDPLTGAVQHDPKTATLSASDAAALEHALRLAEAWGARVLAVAAGGAEVDGALREAAAVGAQVLRVPMHGSYLEDLVQDEQQLARALVRSLDGVLPDLVLCGDRSADRGTGALPAFLAHELGVVQAPGLVSLGLQGSELVGERRIDHGRRERMRIPLPAVCSVEAAGVRLRRAPLQAAFTAAEQAVPVAPAAVPGAALRVIGARPARPRPRPLPPPTGSSRERLLALTGALVDHDPPAIVGPVDAPEAADALLAFLVRHGYLTEARTGWAPA